MSFIFFTTAAVYLVPKYLDQSAGKGVKQLDAVPKLGETVVGSDQVVTRFPTRPFRGSNSAPQTSTTTTTVTDGGTENTNSSGGLPSRVVEGVNSGSGLPGDRVTTRAYLQPNSVVFEQPQTTAKSLGRVSSQTKVRWLAKAGEGWEEILLKDGRSAYVQSGALSFSADQSTSRPGFDRPRNDTGGPDTAALPTTVESFLANLSANDLLRAETYLSPLAPRLDDSGLGSLSPYVGAPALGRVQRIEMVSGSRSGHRRVRFAYGQGMEHEVQTLWEWDAAQNRWMLVDWS